MWPERPVPVVAILVQVLLKLRLACCQFSVDASKPQLAFWRAKPGQALRDYERNASDNKFR
jgi:hypothetical protein